MSVEFLAIALTALVHVFGAAVLVWALLDGERIDWRAIWPRDDDGRGGEPGPQPDAPRSPSGGGLPLPDALPSPVRLRAPGRLADAHPRPARRPAREPQRPAPRVPRG